MRSFNLLTLMIALGTIACDGGKSNDLDNDGDGYDASTDCDDESAAINPGAGEVCDTVDNDCDAKVDADDDSLVGGTPLYPDADGDGFGDRAGSTVTGCIGATGLAAQGDDCNDSDAAINPDATEICDELDNNCDDAIDEGLGQVYYSDNDRDGYGQGSGTSSCNQPPDTSTVGGDCADDMDTINPGVTEVCDQLDNNCDQQVDEGLTSRKYFDLDGDGYGDPGMETLVCPDAESFVDNGEDCADANPDINPGVDERCDGGDNNCNGSIDEDSAVDATAWFLDSDRDGYGDPTTGRWACDQPAQYVENDQDCDDSRQNASPRASEVCNYADDNCDGVVDEDSAVDAGTWYLDLDGDGYSNSGDGGLTTCWMPAGYGANEGDCDNADASINPAAIEACDGIDNDCSGTVDDNAADSDSSGAPDCEEVVVIFAATNVARLRGTQCANGLDGIANSYQGTERSILAAGLYGQRIDEDATFGVLTDLSVYAAIILNSVGYNDSLSVNTYNAVNLAASGGGVPVIFLGDDAAYAVVNTDNSMSDTSFRTLMGLAHLVDNGFGGTVSTVAGQESNLLVDGPFGAVGALNATVDLDIVELASDATAVMELGGYPIVWTRDDGTTRSVTTLVQGYGSTCTDFSGDDLTDAETLLSNALYWATDSSAVIDLDGDGAAWDSDCDDQDPARSPTFSEVCDGIDGDCAGGEENGLRTSRSAMGAYNEDSAFNSDAVTASAWVNVQSQSSDNFIMSKQAISSGGHYAWGVSEVGGELAARFEVSYFNFIDIRTSGLGIQTGDWFHVALSYDDVTGAAKIYYNGVEVASGAGGSGLYYGCSSTPLTIGYASQSGNFCDTRANQYLDAGSDLLIDGVVIYDRALAASDISDLAIGSIPTGYLAWWDFSAGSGSNVDDVGGNYALTMDAGGTWDYTCPL